MSCLGAKQVPSCNGYDAGHGNGGQDHIARGKQQHHKGQKPRFEQIGSVQDLRDPPVTVQVRGKDSLMPSKTSSFMVS